MEDVPHDSRQIARSKFWGPQAPDGWGDQTTARARSFSVLGYVLFLSFPGFVMPGTELLEGRLGFASVPSSGSRPLLMDSMDDLDEAGPKRLQFWTGSTHRGN